MGVCGEEDGGGVMVFRFLLCFVLFVDYNS